MTSSSPNRLQSISPRRASRGVVAAMFGALILGSTLSFEAAAQPGQQRGDHARQGPRFSPPAPILRQPPAPMNRSRASVHQARQQAYHFRGSDRARLQQHYQHSMRLVRVDRRPQFRAGHAIPRAYRSHVRVLPQGVRRHLPPPPRGYQMGYYQGYSVVYDPITFTILSVLDLLRH